MGQCAPDIILFKLLHCSEHRACFVEPLSEHVQGHSTSTPETPLRLERLQHRESHHNKSGLHANNLPNSGISWSYHVLIY